MSLHFFAGLRVREAVIGRADSRTLLGSISCPTLVLYGAGHTPTLERPDAVGPALGALLDRVG